MMQPAWRMLIDDGGVTLVEYALVLAAFSMVVLGGLAAFGTASTTAAQSISDGFVGVQTSP